MATGKRGWQTLTQHLRRCLHAYLRGRACAPVGSSLRLQVVTASLQLHDLHVPALQLRLEPPDLRVLLPQPRLRRVAGLLVLLAGRRRDPQRAQLALQLRDVILRLALALACGCILPLELFHEPLVSDADLADPVQVRSRRGLPVCQVRCAAEAEPCQAPRVTAVLRPSYALSLGEHTAQVVTCSKY